MRDARRHLRHRRRRRRWMVCDSICYWTGGSLPRWPRVSIERDSKRFGTAFGVISSVWLGRRDGLVLEPGRICWTVLELRCAKRWGIVNPSESLVVAWNVACVSREPLGSCQDCCGGGCSRTGSLVWCRKPDSSAEEKDNLIIQRRARVWFDYRVVLFPSVTLARKEPQQRWSRCKQGDDVRRCWARNLEKANAKNHTLLEGRSKWVRNRTLLLHWECLEAAVVRWRRNKKDVEDKREINDNHGVRRWSMRPWGATRRKIHRTRK